MSTAQAYSSILGALVVILGLVAQSMVQNRMSRSQHKETTAKLATVEATVNGTHDALTARVAQLAHALQTAGIEVPPTPDKGSV